MNRTSAALIEIRAVEPVSAPSGMEPVRVDSEALIHSRYETYLRDESSFGPGTAQTIFFPVAEKQVTDFLREMNARKIPVTISGGRTGIVGGAVPTGGALMSMDKMSRIVCIKWDHETLEWRVTAEPGITIREFQQRIARKQLTDDKPDFSDSNWKDLQPFLSDPNQYFYPPDPTEDSASLGGTVATDASGARTYFFGRTRAFVRAIRVVLATGDVLAIRRGENLVDASRTVGIECLDGSTIAVPIPSYRSPNIKSATGYFSQKDMDLIDLFIGSEGTLGVITSVEVAVEPAPSRTAMFLAFFPSEDAAIGFVQHVRSRNFVEGALVVYSMEYFDSNSLNLLRRMQQESELGAGIQLPDDQSSVAILCEFEYQDPAVAIGLLQEPLEEFGSSLENAVTGMEQRDKDLLRALRHAVPEAINKIVAKRKMEIPGMHKLSTDAAVPDDKLQDMMKFYSQRLKNADLEHCVFGHIAENHLHVNILPRNSPELERAESVVYDLAREAVLLGGTVSAEHGIGKMKRDLLKVMFSETAIGQMMKTKRALDPNFILCSGNIFPDFT